MEVELQSNYHAILHIKAIVIIAIGCPDLSEVSKNVLTLKTVPQ